MPGNEIDTAPLVVARWRRWREWTGVDRNRDFGGNAGNARRVAPPAAIASMLDRFQTESSTPFPPDAMSSKTCLQRQLNGEFTTERHPNSIAKPQSSGTSLSDTPPGMNRNRMPWLASWSTKKSRPNAVHVRTAHQCRGEIHSERPPVIPILKPDRGHIHEQ
jgi:hypothetical protein